MGLLSILSQVAQSAAHTSGLSESEAAAIAADAAQGDGGGSGSGGNPLHAMLGRLLPVLLRLACGSEIVARQLFPALLRQMVRGFTR